MRCWTRVEGVRGEGEEEFLVKWKGYRERTWEKGVFEGGRAEGEGVFQAEEEEQEEKGDKVL